MIAIFKREVGAYYRGILGYLFAAFLLIFAGIYTMAYNLSGSIPSASSTSSPCPFSPCAA